MKAIVQSAYGPPELLQFSEIEKPAPGEGEVLVRVLAAGVPRSVWHIVTGTPHLVRVMGYGFRAPKQSVPGGEFAGRVEEVGKDVEGFAAGDEVYGMCRGAFAEFAVALAKKIAPKPSNLTFEQAAVVPDSGAFTALRAVTDFGKVKAGDKVLVLGASGGVGTFAVQIAKAYGAEVTGVCSTGKVDLVRSIGADHVIDYSAEDPTSGAVRYEVILDIGGNRKTSQLRRALAPRGTLVFIGGEEGGRLTGGTGRPLRAALLSLASRQKLRWLLPLERAEELRAMTELIEAGKVTPVIDRTFPLSEAAEAVRLLGDGKVRGKSVVVVSA